MIKKERIKAAMFIACADLVPPLLRDALLSNAKVASEFGLNTDAVLGFGDTGVSFQRSKLFDEVRRAAAKRGKSYKIEDQSGAKWKVAVELVDKSPTVTLKSGKKRMLVGHLLMLTDDRLARRSFFRAEAERLNLPTEMREKWEGIIAERPLSDQEVGELMDAAAQTPIAISSTISDHLSRSNITLEVLVPRSLAYYEHLIGRVDDQPTIKEYVADVVVPHIRNLLEWRPVEGLEYALLLGSHSLISQAIGQCAISVDTLKLVLDWAPRADALSRGALLEIGLRRVTDLGVIGPPLRQLAERFSGISGPETHDQFLLISTAFMMVYGELEARHAFGAKPPYWRRLAALAQAALIVRCILSTKGDLKKFVSWMRSVRPHQFSLQCFADLRAEPRWLADFAMPERLRDEFGGRVLMTAAADENATRALGLYDLLLGDEETSLKSQLNLMFTQLPGPLEGNINSGNEIRPEDLEKLHEGLSEGAPNVTSFAMLVNANLLFRIPDEISDLAADALRRAQYRLDSDGKPDHLKMCLVGLASVAAVTRSKSLSDELFVVIRNYRRNFSDELDIDAAFRIGMISCASRSDLTEWCKCVGALVTDLGFGEITRDEATGLHQVVVQLCELVPELWATCGQGLAAIEAVGLG